MRAEDDLDTRGRSRDPEEAPPRGPDPRGIEPGDVAADLRSRVEGDVLFEPLDRILYSTAACIYQVEPLGAVRPRHEADVLAVLEYARRHRLPVTPRGGGSGLTGGTLGRGIVLDLSKYFRRIGDIDPARGTVQVQPGVIQAELNRALRPHGVHFAPDPSSSNWCTLGGMVSNNAGGSHTIGHGATRENLASVRLALANGEVIDTGPLEASLLAAADAPGTPAGAAALRRLTRGAAAIAAHGRDVIERHQPRTRRNSSGYALREIAAADGRVDLGPLVCGSEGTLGVVLDATVRTLPIPKAKATALVLFDDLEKAGGAVVEILRHRPAAVELLDRIFVEVVRQADPSLGGTLPGGTEAILIVEVDGDDEKEARTSVARRPAPRTSRASGRCARRLRRSCRGAKGACATPASSKTPRCIRRGWRSSSAGCGRFWRGTDCRRRSSGTRGTATCTATR